MNREPQANTTSQQVYVRPSRIQIEPAVFALTVVAVVLSISTWRPQPATQQATPAEQGQTLAAAERS